MTDEYQQFIDAGIEVIAIAPENAEHARAFVDEHGIPFPCLADADHRIYDAYQVESNSLSLGQRPGLFIMDRDGVVRYAYIGSQQWQIPRNADVLEVCRGIPCEVST